MPNMYVRWNKKIQAVDTAVMTVFLSVTGFDKVAIN